WQHGMIMNGVSAAACWMWRDYGKVYDALPDIGRYQRYKQSCARARGFERPDGRWQGGGYHPRRARVAYYQYAHQKKSEGRALVAFRPPERRTRSFDVAVCISRSVVFRDW